MGHIDQIKLRSQSRNALVTPFSARMKNIYIRSIYPVPLNTLARALKKENPRQKSTAEWRSNAARLVGIHNQLDGHIGASNTNKSSNENSEKIDGRHDGPS
jgi:CheY-specific phosphatase CheX